MNRKKIALYVALMALGRTVHALDQIQDYAALDEADKRLTAVSLTVEDVERLDQTRFDAFNQSLETIFNAFQQSYANGVLALDRQLISATAHSAKGAERVLYMIQRLQVKDDSKQATFSKESMHTLVMSIQKLINLVRS